MCDAWIVNFLLLIIIVLSGYILYLLNEHNKWNTAILARNLMELIIFIAVGALVWQVGDAVRFVSQSEFISSYGFFTMYLMGIILYIIVKQPSNIYKFPTVIICLIAWPCYLLSVHYSMAIPSDTSSRTFAILSNIFTAFLTVEIGLIQKGLIEGSADNKNLCYFLIVIASVFGLVVLGMLKIEVFPWAFAFVCAILANTLLEWSFELLKKLTMRREV